MQPSRRTSPHPLVFRRPCIVVWSFGDEEQTHLSAILHAYRTPAGAPASARCAAGLLLADVVQPGGERRPVRPRSALRQPAAARIDARARIHAARPAARARAAATRPRSSPSPTRWRRGATGADNGHGWMGVRFHAHPQARQREALGILGVTSFMLPSTCET